MSADFYDLLELPRSASAEDIRVAIRQQRRLWVRRQSSPDPARRSEAEQRVRDLDQAEKTLLDLAARTAYDRTIAGSVGPAASPVEQRAESPPNTGERLSKHQWLDRARSSLAQGNGSAAARAAREAVNLDRGDAEAWDALGRAYALEDRFDDAEEAFAAAVRLRPDDLDTRVRLAEVYLGGRKWRPAIAEFERVLENRPGDPAARAGLGEACLHTDRIDEGLTLLRAVVAENGDDTESKRALAFALYRQAMDSLAEVPDGKIALSARQVSLLHKNTTQIRALGVNDPQVDAFLADLQGLLDDAQKRVRIRSHNLRYYLAGLAAGLLIAAFAPTEVFQVVAAAIMVGTVLLYVRRHRPRAWRVRRRELARRITKRGI